jgi:type IV pilus assembly protein PilY1
MLFACTALVPTASIALPLTLANTPLSQSVPVESNIMHLLDDSGSMEWEFMVSGTNGGDGNGLPSIGSWTPSYILPSANNGFDQLYSPDHPYVAASEAAVTGGWRARNSSFNTLYYNPTVIYRPWPGNDASGNPLYTNASPSAARVNPNNTPDGTLNLISNISFWNYATSKGGWFYDTIYPAHYYTWTDSDSDGVVDTADTHTLVTITSTTTSYAKASTRTDCAGSTCTYAEEIQNFANWYTYYRKRSYAAKNAIGSVITQASGTRSGLQTYNGGLIRNAISLTSATNRLTLLQDLYDLNIYCTWTTGCPGTPARTALKSLGDLFEGASTPILSAASGGTCHVATPPS